MTNEYDWNARQAVGIVITPFKVWAFPARRCLTFDENTWRIVQQLQTKLGKSGYAVATEFDGGYPKLHIDHFGFHLRIKKGARDIATAEAAQAVLSRDDIESLRFLRERIPPKPPRNARKLRG